MITKNNRIEIPSIGLLRIPITNNEWVERCYDRFAYGNTLNGELRLYAKDLTIKQVSEHLSIDVKLIEELK